ncbi:MAG: hypothetical protein C4341_00880 [Armatimonadota bacterium]
MHNNAFNFGSAAMASALLGLVCTTALWAGQRSTPQSNQGACITRLTHLLRALDLYAGDFDDHYPSAIEYDDARGQYLWNEWHRFNPSVYDAGWTTQTYPYLGNQIYYGCPAATRRVLAGTTGKGPLISYTFNGHLHHYNAAEVANPAELIAIWEGLGNRGVPGYAVSQPVLNCTGKMPKGACRYVPSKSPRSFLFEPLGAVGVHEGRINAGYADTHVRSIAVGKGDWRTGDPFTYSPDGKPNGFWSDGQHPWTFRPEYNFRGDGSPKAEPFQPMPVAR